MYNNLIHVLVMDNETNSNVGVIDNITPTCKDSFIGRFKLALEAHYDYEIDIEDFDFLNLFNNEDVKVSLNMFDNDPSDGYKQEILLSETWIY